MAVRELLVRCVPVSSTAPDLLASFRNERDEICAALAADRAVFVNAVGHHAVLGTLNASHTNAFDHVSPSAINPIQRSDNSD